MQWSLVETAASATLPWCATAIFTRALGIQPTHKRPFTHSGQLSSAKDRLEQDDVPLAKHIHVAKRHELASYHTSDALLAVTPPEKIRDTSPPSGILPSPGCAGFLSKHET